MRCIPGQVARYYSACDVPDREGVVLVVHGIDDDVVPAEQAETIVAALRKHGVPVTQLTFPGEGHGLRRSASIHHALETELTFYRAGLHT
ncbi:MAG: prolyl oligopeptidase family serine peptidase [Pseudonocardiales bacterium]